MDLFLVEDDDLSEKYNTIWDKVSADIKKEFDVSTDFSKTSASKEWACL